MSRRTKSSPPAVISTTTFLEQSEDTVLSVELARRILHPTEVEEYLRGFRPMLDFASKSIVSFAKLFHTGANGTTDIKMKTFGTNEISLMNECTQTHPLSKELTLVATRRTSIQSISQVSTGIDLVQRFAFSFKDLPEWRAEIDLIKSFPVNPMQLGLDELAAAKALLVNVPLESMDPTAYDFVRAAIVSMSNKPVSISNLASITDISGGSVKSVDPAYQEALFTLAKDIFRDENMAERFRQRSGFKRLGANAVELSRPIYFTKVLPIIHTFYVTDKIDGVRAMLIIDETYRRSGHARIFRGKRVYAVSDKIYEIESYEETMKSSTIEVDHTVLDAEMVTIGGKHFFYCFDVIVIASERMSHLPFKQRLARFKQARVLLEKYDLGTTKEFVKLTKDGFGTQIAEFYAKPREYKIDGLVFTPRGMPYREARKLQQQSSSGRTRLFNTNYASTISFKWKPRSHLTIDFYFMRHPTKLGFYVLCSGIDASTFRKLRLQFFDGYIAPKSSNSQHYFPIQFSTDDNSFDNVWAPTTDEDHKAAAGQDSLDGLVGEFVFVSEDDVPLEKQ